MSPDQASTIMNRSNILSAGTNCMKTTGAFGLAVTVFGLAANPLAGAEPKQTPARERISINDHWRFTRGDPTNINSQNLLYDVRPVSRGEDQSERLAEATEDAVKLSAATFPLLKHFILPSGNQFLKDPAKRFVRGNRGFKDPRLRDVSSSD